LVKQFLAGNMSLAASAWITPALPLAHACPQAIGMESLVVVIGHIHMPACSKARPLRDG
jgi:hypothetical protein